MLPPSPSPAGFIVLLCKNVLFGGSGSWAASKCATRERKNTAHKHFKEIQHILPLIFNNLQWFYVESESKPSKQRQNQKFTLAGSVITMVRVREGGERVINRDVSVQSMQAM